MYPNASGQITGSVITDHASLTSCWKIGVKDKGFLCQLLDCCLVEILSGFFLRRGRSFGDGCSVGDGRSIGGGAGRSRGDGRLVDARRDVGDGCSVGDGRSIGGGDAAALAGCCELLLSLGCSWGEGDALASVC